MKLDKCQEQTKHKHLYLKEYLKRWFLVLGNVDYWDTLVYIDSFSNAGIYEDGEKGSPIIALELFDYYLKKDNLNKKVICYFNDYSKEKIDKLKEIVDELDILPNIEVKYEVKEAKFHIEKVCTDIQKIRNKKVIFFLDPYKISENIITMENFKMILNDKDTEIIFNHMVNDVYRNIEIYPEKYREFYRLKEGDKIEKNGVFFNELFIKNIKREVDEKIYITSYELLIQTNITLYFLNFITHHKKGLEKMKEAIWKISDGDFYYKNKGEKEESNLKIDFKTDSGNNFYEEIRKIKIKEKVSDLKGILLEKFKGQIVTYTEVKDFVLEETVFLKSHIINKTLKPLEKENKIKINKKIGSCSIEKSESIEFY